jgi:hypothetical protein
VPSEPWYSPLSRFRWLLDAAWLVGFGVVLVALLWRQEGTALRAGVRLDLVAGGQKRGLYFKGQRLGEVIHRISKREKGWLIEQRFMLAGAPASLARKKNAGRMVIGHSRLELRQDLSLASIAVSADPSRLAKLTGVSTAITSRLGLGKLELDGHCLLETGNCQVQGRFGKRFFRQQIEVGRGPVVPSAVFPLLVRGVLGNRAQLTIFDPISLTRKVIVYQIVERKTLDLDGTLHRGAVRLKQDIEGLDTELWLDKRGRVLKEILPLGVVMKHEAWL